MYNFLVEIWCVLVESILKPARGVCEDLSTCP